MLCCKKKKEKSYRNIDCNYVDLPCSQLSVFFCFVCDFKIWSEPGSVVFDKKLKIKFKEKKKSVYRNCK